MAKCNYCGSETQLYDGGVAICIPCVDVRDKKRLSPERDGDIRTLLMRKLLEATTRANTLSEEFKDVIIDIPSSLPQPDGTQRIRNTSQELSAARKEAIKAHNRLNDYLSHGIVPDDLKLKRGAGQN